MGDYLEIYKKFKDVKEIADYIDDVEKLRYYYAQGRYNDMQHHISNLTMKYIVETIAWNTVNSNMPTTYQQAFINAENFMAMQGAKIIIEKVKEYRAQLTNGEITFIETITKPIG